MPDDDTSPGDEDGDGDGLPDLLVGAPDAGDGEEGRAYLVRGTVSGTVSLADADVEFVGVEGGDEAGTSVMGAGDIDGDGFADLLIGATRDGDLHGAHYGVVYLEYGPSSGTVSLADAPSWIAGENRNNVGETGSLARNRDLAGLAVRAVAEKALMQPFLLQPVGQTPKAVDGYDDLAVGGYTGSYEGQVWVYRGGLRAD